MGISKRSERSREPRTTFSKEDRDREVLNGDILFIINYIRLQSMLKVKNRS